MFVGTTLLSISADADVRRDPKAWSRFNAGLGGTAWYQLRIHRTLVRRLPRSRSTELLGEALRELLASDAYRRLVPKGIAPAVWANGLPRAAGANLEGMGTP